MSIDHIISETYNLRIREVILIGDSTPLLDYGYQFMVNLHVVNSRSQNRTSSHCYLHRVLECNGFSLVEY